MSNNKQRIPRKIKKQIPKGSPYCYTMDMKKQRKEKGFTLHIKSCGFYKHVEGVEGYCRLLNCEIDDQCKSCGLRY
jgi:hypothetical protein